MEILKNKTALITGGSKGIGLGIAEVLVRHQLDVAITSRSSQAAREAAGHLNKIGPGRALGIEADVRDPEAQEGAVREIIKTWGKLDILIANAGLGHFAPVEELTLSQWNEMIDTNLTGVFNSIKATLGELKKSKGYIITIASLAGTNFFAGGSGYNATKFGLVGFTQAVMLDLRHQGINVSTIMPGSVASYFNNNKPDGDDSWKIQPEDLGQMIVDLLHMDPRTLPSKIEVRPSRPPKK